MVVEVVISSGRPTGTAATIAEEAVRNFGERVHLAPQDILSAEGKEIDRARRALRLQRSEGYDREDPFAAVIRCTADPAKADKRTRSKWSRVMRYAAAQKPNSETYISM